MRVLTVTFFGHRDMPRNIRPLLEMVLIDLIKNHAADLFYVGNQGAFDDMVIKTLQVVKRQYPFIQYAVVLAYLPGRNEENYSDTVFPEGLESVPRRYAVFKRNQWMVNHADIVITYVSYTTGGAARFKEISEKKGKRVINLPDLER